MLKKCFQTLNVIRDEDGDYSDWIEIFNPIDTTINLQNFSLSDDLSNLQKWLFPNITISPNEYILIFASGKDRYSSELHTNFSIKASGELIILIDNKL
ncbi:MAG: lamin tail domain-containing protein [Ignavibacteriales bacterium]|nr:lamin tail domain-containing protein [Ignavibacteriales bacterium]